MKTFRFAIHCSWLWALSVGCDGSEKARVQVDLHAMQRHVELNAAVIDDLVIAVRGPGIPDSIMLNLSPEATSFELVVPAGSQREFSLRASRRDGDGRLLPVYQGETVADLPGGTTVEVVIPTYAVGTLLGAVSVTTPDLGLPADFVLTLRAGDPAPGQPQELNVPLLSGSFAQVVPIGSYTFQGASAILDTHVLFGVGPHEVALGGVTPVDLYLYDPAQRCRSFQPESILTAYECLPVSVQVEGLAGSGLELSNNGTDVLSIAEDGLHMFDQLLLAGQPYDLKVVSQPALPTQECVFVAQASGTMPADTGVVVSVQCTTQSFSVGGTIEGLWLGDQVSLTEVGSGQTLTNLDAGTFTFSDAILSGENFEVVVTGVEGEWYEYTCNVVRGTGTVLDGAVSNIAVYCLMPAFPQYFPLKSDDALWNDYVQNNGEDIFSSDGAECGASPVEGYDDCVHAGAMRQIWLGELTSLSCADVVAIRDTRDAFVWSCREGTGDEGDFFQVVSSGLQDGVRLVDLVDYDSPEPHFWPLAVEITLVDGTIYSPESTWWDDEVVVSNSGAVTITTGQLHVVTEPSANVSFVFAEGASSLVFAPGASVLGPGSAISAGGTGDIFVGLWIEGAAIEQNGEQAPTVVLRDLAFAVVKDLQVINGSYGLLIYDVLHSVFRNISVAPLDDSIYVGIHVGTFGEGEGSMHNAFDGIVLARVGDDVAGSFGLRVESPHNTFRNLVISDSPASGIGIFASSNTVQQAVIANHGQAAIESQENAGLRLDQITAYNNRVGISMQGPAAILSNITLFNHQHQGIFADTSRSLFANILVANTLQDGMTDPYFGAMIVTGMDNFFSNISLVNNIRGIGMSLSNSRFHNLSVAHNDVGIFSAFHDNLTFSGQVAFGGNGADCDITQQFEGSGLVEGAGGTCVFDGDIPPQVLEGLNASLSFVGKLADFGAAASTISDWAGFAANRWQGWMLDEGAPAFPSDHQRGRCIGASTCRGFDWRLRSTDEALRGRLPLPTAELVTHTWAGGSGFSPEYCAQNFHGSTFDPGDVVLPETCVTAFILNAVELPGDPRGNGNGLCEVGERCFYTPNFGSFQGEGALLHAIDLTVLDGQIEVVRYATDGVILP